MNEFMDLVMPYSVDVMMDFILKITSVDWGIPEPSIKWDGRSNQFKMYRPQGLNRKLNRLITDFSKKPEHSVFNRWNEWDAESKLPVIQRFGDMPMASIEHVPKERQVFYSCQDADLTGRVRSKLKRLRRRVRHG